MLKIRLTRTGRKNYPSYRIVVTESSKKRDGRFVEILGHYNLQQEKPKIHIDKERFDYWRSQGAQLSEGVTKLALKKGLI